MFFNNMKDWHLQHKQLITPSVSNRWKKWQVGTVQLMQPRSTITVPTLCWDHTMFGEHAPVHCHVCHCRKCKTIPYHQDMYTLLWLLVSTWNWISVNPRPYNITSHHQTSSKHHLSHQAERIFMDTSPPKQWLPGAGVRSGGQIDGATSLIHSAKRSVPSTAHQKPRVSFLLGEKLSPIFFHTMTDPYAAYYTQMFFGIFINYMWLKFMVNVGTSSIHGS